MDELDPMRPEENGTDVPERNGEAGETPDEVKPNAKPPVRFEPMDWARLAMATGLALLWFSVFGIDALSEMSFVPGLGATLFVLAVLAASFISLGKKAVLNRSNAFLLTATVLLSLSLSAFANSAMRVLNSLMLLVLTPMTVFSVSGCAETPWARVSALWETVGLFFKAQFSHFALPFRAVSGGIKTDKKVVGGVALGLVFGLPILAIVMALLTSADAVFKGLFSGLGTWLEDADVGTVLRYVIRTAILTLMLFSALYFTTHYEKKAPVSDEEKEPPLFGEIPKTPVITVLVLLDAVYALFVSVQFACLFGGAETAAMEGGYAEYARSGFFQLVAVAAINLCAVLAVIGITKGKSKAVKILSLILVGMTAVILVSAFWRMRLYIISYGLSFLRAMTLWGMAFTAVCLIAAVLKILRYDFGFWKFFFSVGISMWIVFSFINVDRRIAEYNVDAYLDGKLSDVDVSYLSGLSPDVLPELERLRESAGDVGHADEFVYVLECQKDDVLWQEWWIGCLKR